MPPSARVLSEHDILSTARVIQVNERRRFLVKDSSEVHGTHTMLAMTLYNTRNIDSIQCKVFIRFKKIIKG